MPKINQEEYEVLKELDDKYKWIVRDEDRGLYALTKKPVKKDGPSSYWWDADPYSALGLIDETHLFHFIQWEDEEPYNIAELIEEYEYSADHVSHIVNERVKALGNAWKESEETEVKKQELIKNIKSLARETSQQWPHEEMVELPDVLREINQLDEPEVLSQEFIDKHSWAMNKFGVNTYAVPVGDLQNLLVPKQEEVNQAYKDGYETGKKHAFEKVGWKDKEPETVADVVINFWKSYERLKEAMSMEVEELEE